MPGHGLCSILSIEEGKEEVTEETMIPRIVTLCNIVDKRVKHTVGI